MFGLITTRSRKTDNRAFLQSTASLRRCTQPSQPDKTERQTPAPNREFFDRRSYFLQIQQCLHLIGQTIKDWAREFLAKGEIPDWLVVCDNEKIAELNKDEFVGEVYELGIDPITKIENIKKFISKNSNKKKIIFSTYQSCKNIVEAVSSVGFEFDLTICDEAHKTVGNKDKNFAHLLFDKNIKIK